LNKKKQKKNKNKKEDNIQSIVKIFRLKQKPTLDD
jgi:hypothetical protein